MEEFTSNNSQNLSVTWTEVKCSKYSCLDKFEEHTWCWEVYKEIWLHRKNWFWNTIEHMHVWIDRAILVVVFLMVSNLNSKSSVLSPPYCLNFFSCYIVFLLAYLTIYFYLYFWWLSACSQMKCKSMSTGPSICFAC
jgi:hypothetical protein